MPLAWSLHFKNPERKIDSFPSTKLSYIQSGVVLEEYGMLINKWQVIKLFSERYLILNAEEKATTQLSTPVVTLQAPPARGVCAPCV